MDSDSLRIAIASAAALLGGGGIGWWLRGRYNHSRSVMLDELMTRKVRSFEADREQAVAAHVTAQTAQAHAEEALSKEIDRTDLLENHGAELEVEVQRLQHALAIQQERVEKVELYAVELDKQLKAAKEWRAASVEATQTLHKRLRRLRTYPPRLEECESELVRLKAEFEEATLSREAEIVRLTDWIAELTPLTETLRARDKEVTAQRERFERAEVSLDEKLSEVTAKFEAGRADERQLREQLAEAQSGKAANTAKWVAAQQELTHLQDLLASHTTELTAGRAALEKTREEREAQRQEAIALSLKVTELGMYLKATRDEVSDEAVAMEGLRVELEGLRGELESARGELDRAAGRVHELERMEADRVAASMAAKQQADKEKAALKTARVEERVPETLPAPPKQAPELVKKAAKIGKSVVAKGSAKKSLPEPDPVSRAKGVQKKSQATKTVAKKPVPKKEPVRKAPVKKVAVKRVQKKSSKAPVTRTPSKTKATKKKATKRPAKKTSTASISIAADDFSAIKGIGPKVVERLRAAGILTYAQFVSLGRQDVRTLAEQLRVPEKRILREKWLQSAEKLAR